MLTGEPDPAPARVLPGPADRTVHTDGFVLKGGILLAAYGVRRPTKDAVANAIHSNVAAVNVGDRVVLDTGTISVKEIREQADYAGLRVQVKASPGPWTGTAAWDISTGDPITPVPTRVHIPDRVARLRTGNHDRREGRHHPRARHYQHSLARLHRYRPCRPPRHRRHRAPALRARRRPLPRRGARTGWTASCRVRRDRSSQLASLTTHGEARGRQRGGPGRPGRTRRLQPRPGLQLRPRLTPHPQARGARPAGPPRQPISGTPGGLGRCARMATHLADPCRLDSFLSEPGK